MADFVARYKSATKAPSEADSIQFEELDSIGIEEVQLDTPKVSTTIGQNSQVRVADFPDLDRWGNSLLEVNPLDAVKEIDELRRQFSESETRDFIFSQRDILLGTILDRFMLGGITAARDVEGGPVTTLHNAKEGVYASSADMQRFEREYDSRKYHDQNPSYRMAKQEMQKSSDTGTLRDSYAPDRDISGRYFQVNKNGDTREMSTAELDHVVSAKAVHEDPRARLYMTEEQSAALANNPSNLAPTHEAVNGSKLEKDADEWMNRESSSDSSKTNAEAYRVDRATMEKLNRDSKAVIQKELTKSETQFYVKNTLAAAGAESAQMGIRQIVGTFISEAILAIFDEIKRACQDSRAKGSEWWDRLKAGVERVVNRVRDKWRDALDNGFQGALSGFFSSIVTVIINLFMTTAKNLVRLIREGFLSLVKAAKMLVSPPSGMSRNAVLHEVGKIVVSSLIVSVGILMQEIIEKFPPMVAIKGVPVVGELLVDVVFGLLVAVTTSLALWGWDKLDLFDAKEEARHDFVMSALSQRSDSVDKRRSEWLEQIRVTDPLRYQMLVNELGF